MSKTAAFPMSAFPSFASCSFDCPPWDGPDPTDDSYPCVTASEVQIVEAGCFAYVGNAPGSQEIDVGFQPDLVWLKNGDATGDWWWIDSTNGEGFYLKTNSNVGLTGTSAFSFLTDGFSVGNNSVINGSTNNIYGLAVKKETAFFDIATYTGNGSATQTVSHSLGAVPELIIGKRTDTGTTSWVVYHANSGGSPQNLYGLFNSDNAFVSGNLWGNTAPTSTQFTVGGNNNLSGYNVTNYLFASVSGKCKIGKYIGNATTKPTITTGFQASYIMIKNLRDDRDWQFITSCMSAAVPATKRLIHNLTGTVGTDATGWLNFNTSNIEILTTNNEINATGDSYVYMALA